MKKAIFTAMLALLTMNTAYAKTQTMDANACDTFVNGLRGKTISMQDVKGSVISFKVDQDLAVTGLSTQLAVQGASNSMVKQLKALTRSGTDGSHCQLIWIDNSTNAATDIEINSDNFIRVTYKLPKTPEEVKSKTKDKFDSIFFRYE